MGSRYARLRSSAGPRLELSGHRSKDGSPSGTAQTLRRIVGNSQLPISACSDRMVSSSTSESFWLPRSKISAAPPAAHSSTDGSSSDAHHIRSQFRYRALALYDFKRHAPGNPRHGCLAQEFCLDSTHVMAHRSAQTTKGGPSRKRSGSRAAGRPARSMHWPMLKADRSRLP